RPAGRAERLQVAGDAGEGVDPGRAEDARVGCEGGSQLLRLGEGAGRADVADADAAALEGEPRQEDGGGGPVGGQHLVALAQRKAVGEQVHAVGGAVAEDDLVGGHPEEPAQGAPQPRRHLCEAFRGELERADFPGDRLAGLVGRDARQRPLVGAVQPHLAVEGAEVRVIPRLHPSTNHVRLRPASQFPCYCRARVDSYESSRGLGGNNAVYNEGVSQYRLRDGMGTPTESVADHNIIGWRFDNTYARLPDVLFTPARTAAFREP